MYKGSVVVTGCDSGLGFSLCSLLPLHGFYVIATCKSDEGHQRVCEALKNDSTHNNNVSKDRRTGFTRCLSGASYVLDITVPSAVEEFRRTVLSYVADRTFPPIYALVNNAGVWRLSLLEECLSTSEQQNKEIDAWKEIMEINFFGTLRMTLSFANHLGCSSDGLMPRIIFVSSVLDRHALPGHGAYVASKFAVNGLYETLSHEFAEKGVKPIIVRPGALGNTKLFHADLHLDDPDYKQSFTQDSDILQSSYRHLLKLAGGDCHSVARTIVQILEDTNPRDIYSNVTGGWPFLLADYMPRQIFVRLVRMVLYTIAKVSFCISRIFATIY